MSYEVSPDELTAHASHLDGLKDRLDQAVSAADTGGMSEDAFGLLCSFLPPDITPLEQRGAEALRAASEGVSKTAKNVRDTANEYRDGEKTGSNSVGALLKDHGAERGSDRSASRAGEV